MNALLSIRNTGHDPAVTSTSTSSTSAEAAVAASNPQHVATITSAVVGALTGAVIIIAVNTFTQNHTAMVDVPSVLIAVATIFALVYIKKIQEPHIILIAAVIILKTVL